MKEKLTDRIGIISLFFYTILFFAQIVGVICNFDMVTQIIMFVAYNICIAIIMTMLLETNKKLKDVLIIAIATDIILVLVCLLAYRIKMMTF